MFYIFGPVSKNPSDGFLFFRNENSKSESGLALTLNPRIKPIKKLIWNIKKNLLRFKEVPHLATFIFIVVQWNKYLLLHTV